ncbi:MAG TPA: CHAT domain-containing protein [Ornithinibacter sp.]|nr:CHAT domain-containing protein [Ornithinibacter sp.]
MLFRPRRPYRKAHLPGTFHCVRGCVFPPNRPTLMYVAASDLRLTGAFLLDADLTAAVALRAVAALAPEASTVVLDRTCQPVRYTVVSAGLVARAARRSDSNAPLRDVLRLDTLTPSRVVDLATQTGVDAESQLSAGTVVVRGPEVIGVVIADGSDRGSGGHSSPPPHSSAPSPPAAPEPEPQPPSDPRGWQGEGEAITKGGYLHGVGYGGSVAYGVGYADDEYGAGRGGYGGSGSGEAGTGERGVAPAAPDWSGQGEDGHESATADEESVTHNGDPPSAAQGTADPDTAPGLSAEESTGRFHAFPRTNAPAIVAARMPFDLEVGFTSERPVQPAGAGPVVLFRVGATVTFEVQVAGLGFDFPKGIKFPLVVDREAPTGTVKVPVVAQPVPTRTTRRLRVTYAHEGAIVGDAWCELDVIPEGDQPLEDADTPDRGARWGGTGLVAAAPTTNPDLTVTIRTTPGRPEVEWLFTTPHHVAQPSERVTTEFRDGTAEAFANALMAQLPADKGRPLLLADVTGLGVQVASAYPTQFWRLLDAIWDAVPEGTVPTLLLMTSEPFVPWELAYLEPDRFITGQRAKALDGPLLLGAQWSIGRWLSPVPQAFGPDRPPAPPQEVVEAPTMAVVKGDYTKAGVKALPGAVREAEELALAYDAVIVPIDESSVARLLDDQIEHHGQPYRPVVLHFACHGQADSTNLQHTGILLDDRRLLGPLAIEGSALGRSAKPFVFLNACQVGAAAYTLNGYGGLAGAFIRSGARGFVAPLWNVDDDLALELSSGFYNRVLDQGESVGEALRLMRRSFTDGGVRTATPLAYVFYGHPKLRLTRTE